MIELSLEDTAEFKVGDIVVKKYSRYSHRTGTPVEIYELRTGPRGGLQLGCRYKPLGQIYWYNACNMRLAH